MKKIKLGDICKINLNSYSVANDNYKFVNYLDTSNITQNEIAAIQKINLESEILPSRAKRKVKTDSIIYSTVRPNQKHFGIIKSQPKNFLVSTGFAVIDVIPEKIDANFLFYQLSQEKIIQHLQSIAEQSMTSYPAIRPDDLKNLEIDLPPLEVQKQIGNFLYSLDQKISINKKINATLEEMAKTIYDYYFVQFDFPDENGKPYKSSGGKMIFSPELQREIPEGWQVGKIGDLAEMQAGFAFKSSEWKKFGHPVLTIKNINSDGSIDIKNSSHIEKYEDFYKKYSVSNGNIIFAMTGNTIGKIGIISSDIKNILINQRVLILKTTAENIAFLYFNIIDDNIQNLIFKLGANSAQPNISEEKFSSIKICMPPRNILEFYNSKCCKLFQMIIQNRIENNLLENLRDFLLPMLMNGQVSFKEED